MTTYRAWNLKTLDRAAVRELTHEIAALQGMLANDGLTGRDFQ